MESTLKTKTVDIKSLGQAIEIRELSAKAYIEIAEAKGKKSEVEMHALACLYGVTEWSDETVDDLLQNISVETINEIAPKIYRLSEVAEAKNSDRVPSAVSSTG